MAVVGNNLKARGVGPPRVSQPQKNHQRDDHTTHAMFTILLFKIDGKKNKNKAQYASRSWLYKYGRDFGTKTTRYTDERLPTLSIRKMMISPVISVILKVKDTGSQ